MSSPGRARGASLLVVLVFLLVRGAAAGSDPSAAPVSPLPAAPASAQTTAEPQPSQPGGPSPDEIARLVRQLGSDSFAAREQATRQLIALGIAARDALAAACDEADAEVRMRARAVLAAVSETDFRERLAAFSADFDGRNRQTLPGWQEFSAHFGGGRSARQLFVEMQRAEPELLEAFAKGSKPATESLGVRCQAISQQAMHSPREEQISMGTVASMLLVGSAEGVTIEEQAGLQLYTWMIYQPAFQKNAASGAWSPLLKKLLGRWVMKDAGAAGTVQNLLFAASYELKTEALYLAHRVLANDHNHANTRQYAVLIVGRFGGKEHVPLVEKLLDDTASCGTFQVNNPPRQVDLQIRDIALAVAVHLTGQNLRDYGFQSAQPNPTTLFQVATLLFHDPAERDAALKKWSAWRLEHPEL